MNKFNKTALILFIFLSLSNCNQTVQPTSSGESTGDSAASTPADNTGVTQDGTDQTDSGSGTAIEDPVTVQDPSDPSADPLTPPAGILFGFWGLNGYHTSDGYADVFARFGTTVFQVASSSPNYTVNTLLPLVRASGMKVTLRMTDDHSAYTTAAGDFDLDLWKVGVTAWQDSGVQEFIDDGTLVGHMILDDIVNFTGADPTASDLDEMARYSKEILPGLMTFVREKATRMPVPDGGVYLYVDACVNQYTAYTGFPDGPVETYATEQAAAAQALGLGIVNGLNIADGGDGSSGQAGWESGKYAMSADEITTYGAALLNVPDIMMFLLWEYDGEELWSDGITIGSNYFDQPELQMTLYNLSQIAASYEP